MSSRRKARQLGGEDEGGRRSRRDRPAASSRARPAADRRSIRSLEREQVAQRIPARKATTPHRSMLVPHRGRSEAGDRRSCPTGLRAARGPPWYDRQVLPSDSKGTMADTIHATRLRKGMLIKIDNDLFRILELQHVTPGNLRGFVRVKLRNIRNGALTDQKLRSEDVIERATLDEREMQYLYNDGDDYYFMDTDDLRADPHLTRGALGDSVDYLKPEMTDPGRVLRRGAGRHRAAADRGPEGHGHRARHQGRDGQRPGQAGDARDGRSSCRCRRSSTRATSIRVNTETGEYQAARLTGDLACSSLHGRRPARPTHGWIEVIIGSMFSGKSEELIRRLRRAQIARQRVQIFKPIVDTRFARRPHRVAQRACAFPSENVATSRTLLEQVGADTEVVGHRRRAVLRRRAAGGRATTLADRGKRVIVAGLDQDYLGKPFEPMPQLLAIAEYITKTLRHLHGVRQPGQPHAAARGQPGARAARRAGHLRGPLPALLRSHAGRDGRAAAAGRRRARRRGRGQARSPDDG